MLAQFGLAAAVRKVGERVSRLVELQVELARLEMKEKARRYGVGIGLGLAAAVFGFFAIVFLLVAAVVALALVLDLWLAVLLVGVVCLGFALLLGGLAADSIRKAGKPVPEEALEEARLTAAAVKADGTS
jgi:Flp pilus assembly protein TadB